MKIGSHVIRSVVSDFTRRIRWEAILCCLALVSTAAAQQWTKESVSSTVPGFWNISMFDTGRGVSGGFASVPLGITGVARRSAGNSTWQTVSTSAFSPALGNGFLYWSGTSAIRNTGTAFICGANGAVYRTTDYGNTWTGRANGISASVSLFDVFFKNASIGVVVGSGGAAYYTTDGGATWASQSTGTTNTLYAVHSAGSYWYVSGANNTMLRYSPPSSWTDLSTNLPSGNTFSAIEGLQFLDDQIGTFCGYNSSSANYVFRTTNGGSSWNAFPSQPPISSSSYGVQFYSTLYFFTQNAGWVANVFDKIGFTSDGGNTWATYSPSGSATGAISKLDFLDRQTGYASGGALGGTGLEGFILRYSGPPPMPDISTSASVFDFGILTCDSLKDTTYTIINSGTDDLIIPKGGVTFSSPDLSYIGPALPITILPGQQRAISIRWRVTPFYFGSLSGETMMISSNDAAHSPWIVSLDGQRNYSYTRTLETTFQLLGMCGNTDLDTTITVYPYGIPDPALLDLRHASGDTSISLVSPARGSIISGPTMLHLRIRSQKTGPFNATYILSSGNTACPDEYQIHFLGTVNSNTIVSDQDTLEFGYVCSGGFRDKTVSLKNTGISTGTIEEYQLVSGNDRFFTAPPSQVRPIKPDSSVGISFRFSPAPGDTGFIAATYRIIIGPCLDTVYLTMRGRIDKPQFALFPPGPVTIGPVVLGEDGRYNLSVINTGTAPVTVSDLLLQPPQSSLSITGAPALPVIIQPGQMIPVVILYRPAKIETITARLCVIVSDPCADTLCVPLSASSSEAPHIVTGTMLDLGLQACRQAVHDSIMIRNTGRGPLILSSFDITGPQQNQFRVLRPVPPATISPGDSIFVVIEYSSPFEGPSSATLSIRHNDASAGYQSIITLSGRRTVTELTLDGDTATAMTVCIHDTTDRTYYIRNNSTHPLDIRNILLSAPGAHFSVSHQPLPETLQPGTGFSMTLTFHPTSDISERAGIRIVSDPCNDTVTFQIAGVTQRARVAFAPSSIDFGSVTIGTPVTRVIQLSNPDAAAITIEDVFLRPPHPAMSIIQKPAMPLTIPPYASSQVTVQYLPTAAGSLFTSVCAATSFPCTDTTCMTLLGVARGDGLAFDRSTAQLTLDPCSFSAICDTIILSNDASKTITVTDISLDQTDACTATSVHPVPFSLAGGQTAPIVVCAQPTFTGSRTVMLSVRCDDPRYPLLQLPIALSRDSVAVSVLRDTVRFTPAIACMLPVLGSIALSNTGSIDDEVELVRAPDPPFAIVTGMPFRLRPGWDSVMLASFAPMIDGTFRDSVVLQEQRCHRRSVIHLEGTRLPTALLVAPDPVQFGSIAVGASQSQAANLENHLHTMLRIAAVRINPPGEFGIVSTPPMTIDSLERATIVFEFVPRSAGQKTAVACLILDQPCLDSVCLTLRGTGSDPELPFFTTTPLVFSVLAQCEEQTRRDTLVNNGSQPVGLKSSRIIGGSDSAFSLLDPVTALEVLPSGGRRIFTIRLRPDRASDGFVRAKLRLETDLPTVPEIELPLQGTRVTQVTPSPATLAFGNIPRGTTSQTTLPVTNTGTSSITITSALLPPDVTITPPLPRTIQPGETEVFTVAVTPTTSGDYHDVLRLIIGAPCQDTTAVTVTASVYGAVSLIAVTDTIPDCMLNFIDVVFRNMSGQPVRITGRALTGSDAGAFVPVAPPSFPLDVRADDSLTFRFALTPIPSGGSRSYTARVSIAYTIGNMDDSVAASLQVIVVTPVPQPVRELAFGAVSIGTTKTVDAAFVNVYPFPVRVRAVRSLDTLVTVQSVSLPLPAILSPGDSVTLTLAFSPIGDSVCTGLGVQLVSDQPCDAQLQFPATGAGVDNFLHASISFPELSGAPDDHIMVPVLLHTDIGTTGSTSWSGYIRFNPKMLYPLKVVTAGSLSEAMNVTSAYEHKDGVFHLSASGSPVRGGIGPLVYIEFLVLIGDSISTPLFISQSFDFLDGMARIRSRQNGEFSLSGYCSGNGSRLITQNHTFTLYQNSPNPFNPETEIEFETVADGIVDLTISDAMGRTVAVPVHEFRPAGRYRIIFHAEGLPSGTYFYTLRSGLRLKTRLMLLSR